MRNTSWRVALCGVTAALMLAVMLLGTMFPFCTYICPGLAGLMSIPVVWELGGSAGGLLYVAVSVLSMVMAPDKESALLFVLILGWYPILRPRMQHIRNKALCTVLKLLFFNVAIALLFVLLRFVFLMPDYQPDSPESLTGIVLAAFLLLGNITFLGYDLLLSRFTDFYIFRLRPKIFPKQHQ